VAINITLFMFSVHSILCINVNIVLKKVTLISRLSKENRWAEYVACMKGKTIAYSVLMGRAGRYCATGIPESR
jgi:hypothetical protein